MPLILNDASACRAIKMRKENAKTVTGRRFVGFRFVQQANMREGRVLSKANQRAPVGPQEKGRSHRNCDTRSYDLPFEFYEF